MKNTVIFGVSALLLLSGNALGQVVKRDSTPAEQNILNKQLPRLTQAHCQKNEYVTAINPLKKGYLIVEDGKKLRGKSALTRVFASSIYSLTSSGYIVRQDLTDKDYLIYATSEKRSVASYTVLKSDGVYQYLCLLEN